MRQIHLAEGLRLRFPGRTEEFDQGVEIGILAALMDHGLREFSRSIAETNLEQARALASKMGYRLVAGPSADGLVEASFRYGRARPALKLVSSVA
jgi:hypothetical protein